MLTTSKADEDIYKSYDLGVNSYIVKPVTFEALVDILQTLEKYWFEIVELPPRRTGSERRCRPACNSPRSGRITPQRGLRRARTRSRPDHAVQRVARGGDGAAIARAECDDPRHRGRRRAAVVAHGAC